MKLFKYFEKKFWRTIGLLLSSAISVFIVYKLYMIIPENLTIWNFPIGFFIKLGVALAPFVWFLIVLFEEIPSIWLNKDSLYFKRIRG